MRIRDGVQKDAMGEMQPPVYFFSGKFRQGQANRGVKPLISLGEFFLNERLKISAWLGQALGHEANKIAAPFGAPCDELDRGSKQSLEDFFNWNWFARRLLTETFQEKKAFLVKRLHSAAQNSEDEGVFGREMIIDGAEIDLGSAGDGAERGRLESVGGEEPLGGVEDGELSMWGMLWGSHGGH